MSPPALSDWQRAQSALLLRSCVYFTTRPMLGRISTGRGFPQWHQNNAPPSPNVRQRWGGYERTNANNAIYSYGPIQLPIPLVLSSYSFVPSAHFIGSISQSGRVLLFQFKLAHCPARPLFTRILTSTRRFSARPCAVSLGAVGSAVPIAPGATTCRTGTLQSWIK
jgi:hypothetical protein